jgi:hypothetical protein
MPLRSVYAFRMEMIEITGFYYFWLGNLLEQQAEEEAEAAGRALWAYWLDGSEAARRFREVFSKSS